jgi:hypothetical protein
MFVTLGTFQDLSLHRQTAASDLVLYYVMIIMIIINKEL